MMRLLWSGVHRAVWNLVLLVVGAGPLFFLLTWLQALLQQTEGSQDVGYMLETGGFYAVVLLGPVLLGGVAQQVALMIVPLPDTAFKKRLVAGLLSCLIPLAVVALAVSLEVVLWFGVPVLFTLAAYTLLIRIPI